MEALTCSETSVNFYHTSRRYIPEGGTCYSQYRENLKSLSLIGLFSTLMMEVIHSSETANFYRATWHHIAEVTSVTTSNPAYCKVVVELNRLVQKETFPDKCLFNI
jgi:hypothetical protein